MIKKGQSKISLLCCLLELLGVGQLITECFGFLALALLNEGAYVILMLIYHKALDLF